MRNFVLFVSFCLMVSFYVFYFYPDTENSTKSILPPVTDLVCNDIFCCDDTYCYFMDKAEYESFVGEVHTVETPTNTKSFVSFDEGKYSVSFNEGKYFVEEAPGILHSYGEDNQYIGTMETLESDDSGKVIVKTRFANGYEEITTVPKPATNTKRQIYIRK